MNELGACPKSPVYVNSGHQLCVFGLFKGNVEAIRTSYQAGVMTTLSSAMGYGI